MSKIDEFKTFVKTKPELISYVRNGEMTWQKFYEVWDIYGPDHDEWKNYKAKEGTTNTNNSKDDNRSDATAATAATNFGITDLFNMFKKVDLNSIKNNISGIQKAIGLIQDMTSKTGTEGIAASAKSAYTPRPMFRRFDD